MHTSTAFFTLLSVLLLPALIQAQLDTAMKNKGKRYFGTCLDPGGINNGNLNPIARSADFGCFTPENSAKWDATEPNRGQFSFGNFDTLVNFAQTNGKFIRGHTLVWHAQLPSWVSSISSASDLTSVLQNHVTTLVTRYKGKLLHWDVVNECIDDSGSGALRSSVWTRVLGEQFIDIAFKAARAADPNVKLYINDYGMDRTGGKTSAMISLIGRLKSRGVPIDGVGTQAHLTSGQVSGFPAALSALAGTGLDVAITELDIAVSSSSQFGQQANDYATVVTACMNTPKCVGITTWGISDSNSWISSKLPLLWNTSYQKKQAYTSALNAINAGPASSTTTTTTTTTTTPITTTTPTTTTSSTTTFIDTTSNPGGCTVAKWGQCGGETYTGCTTCASGSTCTYSNPWYSQCL